MTEEDLWEEDEEQLKDLVVRCGKCFKDLGYQTLFEDCIMSKNNCAVLLNELSESRFGTFDYSSNPRKVRHIKIKFRSLSELDLKLTIRGY